MGPRSYLVVPAIRAERYLGHLQREALCLPDAVVLDLEDSVPAELKQRARAILSDNANTLMSLRTHLTLFLRVNHPSTPFYDDDLGLIRALPIPELGLAMPKTESAQEAQAVLRAWNGPTAAFLPTIETLRGYNNRCSILRACASTGVTRVVFGAEDMALELGVDRPSAMHLLHTVFCNLLISAAQADIGIVDAPSRIVATDAASRHAFREECSWAWGNGAAAKIAIHPQQIARAGPASVDPKCRSFPASLAGECAMAELLFVTRVKRTALGPGMIAEFRAS